jgi:putative glutamine amidotransferase
MKRPLVGIVPLYDEDKKSLWMLPGYMNMLEESGALPLMLPLTDEEEVLKQSVSMCDGILFTGGHDVDPALYGEEKKAYCGPLCRDRDRMETILLNLVLSTEKSVLGICRGLQFINVSLGGTLYQDLKKEHPGAVSHHMDPPYDRSEHSVRICKDTLLEKIFGERESICVNSCHHQGIKDPASLLRVDAVSEDGLVEAVDLPDHKFFLAVQWHPEFLFEKDEDSRKIIHAYVHSML